MPRSVRRYFMDKVQTPIWKSQYEILEKLVTLMGSGLICRVTRSNFKFNLTPVFLSKIQDQSWAGIKHTRGHFHKSFNAGVFLLARKRK